ncbi:MAG: BACON domain-containing carbohydrate-binding protein [Rikenellaceae bacterium]
MKRLENISLMSRLWAVMLCATLVLGSCASNSIDTQRVLEPALSLDMDLEELTSGVVEVDNSAKTITFSLTSNSPWVIESDQEWCTLSHSRSSEIGLSADITITLEENVAESVDVATRSGSDADDDADAAVEEEEVSPFAEDRTVNITIYIDNVAKDLVITITQTQRAFIYELDVLPAESNLAINSGSSVEFMLLANSIWSVESDVEWLTFSPASGVGSASYQTVEAITTEMNTTGLDRVATITVTCGDLSESFEVSQNGFGLSFMGDTAFTALAVGDSFSGIEVYSTTDEWEVECDTEGVVVMVDDNMVAVDLPWNSLFMTRYITLSLKSGDNVGSNTVVIEQPMHSYGYSFGALEGADYTTYNADGSATISHTLVQARFITPMQLSVGTYVWKIRDLVKDDSTCISINFQDSAVINCEIYGVGEKNFLTTNGGGQWAQTFFALDDSNYSSALGEIMLTIFPTSDDVMEVNLYLDGVNVLSTERLNWLESSPQLLYFGLRYNGNTTNKVTFESFYFREYDATVDGGSGSNPDINLSFATTSTSVDTAGETITLNVSTDLSDWSVTSNVDIDGLTITENTSNGTVEVVVPANTSVEARTITLSIASDSEGKGTNTCVISQDGVALEFDFAAGNDTTISAAGGDVTLSVDANVSDWTVSADLDGVTFGSIDYTANTVVANIPVNALAADRDIKFTIATTSAGGASKTHTLAQEAADVVLKFADGNIDAISSKGGDITLAVTANVSDWTIDCNVAGVTYGAIDYTANTVVVTIPVNSESSDVVYAFTISTSVDSTEATFEVTQAAQGVELEFEDADDITLTDGAAVTKTIDVYASGVGEWTAKCDDADVTIGSYDYDAGTFEVAIPANNSYADRTVVITLYSETDVEYASLNILQPAGASFAVDFVDSITSIAANGETQTLSVTTSSIASGDKWVVACDHVGVSAVNNGDDTATVKFTRNPYFFTSARTFDLYLTSESDPTIVGGKIEGISQDPITYSTSFPGAGSSREVNEETGAVKITFEGGLQARLSDASNKYGLGTYTMRVSDIDKAGTAAINIQLLTTDATKFFNLEIQGNYGSGSNRNYLSINAGSGAVFTYIDLLNSNQGLYDAMEELTLSVLPKDGDATTVVASVLINGTQVVSTEIDDWVSALGDAFTPYIGLRLASAVDDVSVMTIDSFVIEPYEN